MVAISAVGAVVYKVVSTIKMVGFRTADTIGRKLLRCNNRRVAPGCNPAIGYTVALIEEAERCHIVKSDDMNTGIYPRNPEIVEAAGVVRTAGRCNRQCRDIGWQDVGNKDALGASAANLCAGIFTMAQRHADIRVFNYNALTSIGRSAVHQCISPFHQGYRIAGSAAVLQVYAIDGNPIFAHDSKDRIGYRRGIGGGTLITVNDRIVTGARLLNNQRPCSAWAITRAGRVDVQLYASCRSHFSVACAHIQGDSTIQTAQADIADRCSQGAVIG